MTSHSSAPTSWFERCYATLLRCYPHAFRERFAGQMMESVRRDDSAARTRGLGAVLMFRLRTLVDAIFSGVAARRGPRTPQIGGPSSFSVDWRDAYRALRATPVVTAVALLSLALGIGANTALFSILNSVLLKQLPVRAPEELVAVHDGSWTNPIWEAIRDRKIFLSAFAWSADDFNVADRGESDMVPGVHASGDYFNVLGVRPALGRFFGPDDDTPGGGANGPVVVISYGFWQRRFGGEPSVVGRQLRADGLGYTIIGVTPAGFFGPDVGRMADLMVPIGDLALQPENKQRLTGRSNWWLEIIGRLAPGQTLAVAQQQLQHAQPAIREATLPPWPAKMLAGYLDTPFTLDPAGNGLSALRGTYVEPLEIILVVVGAVLIIACANIANLLLARATARQREFSVRLALGASRARIVRQLLAESAILAVLGAVAGLALAQWGSALLVREIGRRGAAQLDLAPDWRVFAFTAAVAVVTALVFGVAPAVGIGGVAPNDALKEQGRSVIGDRKLGIRNALVVIQVGLSLALVLGGALFLRTFQSLTSTSIGMSVDPVFVVAVNGNRLAGNAEAARAPFTELLDAVRATPGVAAASLCFVSPMSGSGWNTVIGSPEGTQVIPDRQRLSWINPVTPDWFKTFGVPMIAGRDFDAHDTAGMPKVVIVNEAFAQKYLPNQTPVGSRITANPSTPTAVGYTVVGLVRNAIYRNVRAGFEPTAYFPVAQMDAAKNLTLGVRSAGTPPAALAAAVGRSIERAMPDAGFNVRLLSDEVGSTVRQERLLAMLAGFFGVLALLLAALGLYGVTSYAVSRRRSEIGIRMALGADRMGVIRLVVGRVVLLVGLGVGLGAGLSFWASTFVGKLLYEVKPHDPKTFALASALLAVAAIAAGWLPARRAASIDPAKALRES